MFKFVLKKAPILYNKTHAEIQHLYLKKYRTYVKQEFVKKLMIKYKIIYNFK